VLELDLGQVTTTQQTFPFQADRDRFEWSNG
jgi:hypothetical protein